jgi:hypothetical protein
MLVINTIKGNLYRRSVVKYIIINTTGGWLQLSKLETHLADKNVAKTNHVEVAPGPHRLLADSEQYPAKLLPSL